MKNIKIKILLLGIIIAIAIFLPSISKSAFISISASKTNANPGETISITISSDSVGRVNLLASNGGKLSSNRVWIEGTSQTVNLTVGTQGTTTVTAKPEGGQMSYNKVDVPVAEKSVNISINSTNNNSNSNSNNSSSTNNNTSNSKTETKSNVAILSNLGIKPNDFSGFKSGTFSYDVEVPNEVETIEVYASKGQSGQKISGTGNKTLNEGQNKIEINVTAEDGTTKKTYTINVNRKAKEESSEETEPQEVFGLSELKLEGIELKPEFQTDIYEYKVNVGEDIENLKIATVATEANSNIEITGNENFHEGENIVTILVTNENGEKTTTYQIIANKEAKKEEANNNIKSSLYDTKNLIYIAGGIVILVILIIIVAIKMKNDKDSEEFSIPYSYIPDEKDSTEEVENDLDDTSIEEPKKKKHPKGKRFK